MRSSSDSWVWNWKKYFQQNIKFYGTIKRHCQNETLVRVLTTVRHCRNVRHLHTQVTGQAAQPSPSSCDPTELLFEHTRVQRVSVHIHTVAVELVPQPLHLCCSVSLLWCDLSLHCMPLTRSTGVSAVSGGRRRPSPTQTPKPSNSDVSSLFPLSSFHSAAFLLTAPLPPPAPSAIPPPLVPSLSCPPHWLLCTPPVCFLSVPLPVFCPPVL